MIPSQRCIGFGIAVLAWGLTTLALFARGGGGCLEQGTFVLTPTGPMPVELLQPGDKVVGISRGAVVTSQVHAVSRVQPREFYNLAAGGHVLHVTAEHPLAIAPGVFRMAGRLREGETVTCLERGKFQNRTVTAVARAPAEVPAYNLMVAPGGTFVAGGVAVHNKGCFLPETRIRLADGTEIPIASVQTGDRLLAFTSEGSVVCATVQRVLTHDVDEYRVVKTAQIIIQVTDEHPFYVGEGTFKTLEALQPGDSIFAFDGRGMSAQRIESITIVRAPTRVFNLQTDAPNTFFANGIAVHNKGGGCFPAGTLIKTPGGETPIKCLAPGDHVTAIDPHGGIVTVRVQQTHVTFAPVLTIQTPDGVLKTTAEHPLGLADGRYLPAGEIALDEQVMIWRDGESRSVTVTSKQIGESAEPVYNLTVAWPHTFVADNFIVHNKGGGGGHSSFHGSSGHRGGGSGSGDNGWVPFVFFIGFIVVICIINIAKRQKSDENLDFVYSPAQVASKSEKTRKLLEFLARQDQAVAPEALKKQAETTFLKLQQCWQARDYGPMVSLMMPDLYDQHRRQIDGMVRNHEINIIENVRVDRLDIVNIRYTFKEEQREFTALITATARDYYVDDRSRQLIRGDKTAAQFQEFWTFQRLNKNWLLREIEQTRESDVLKEENFFEQFTDVGVNQIYGETAGKAGPAGPWLEKQVETKESRIERLLNFLVQTDKLWNRQAMLETSRRVFLQMMLAWETGDPAAAPADDMFPDLAGHLRDDIAQNKAQGVAIEYRNLCVRKAELVLVRNFTDNSKDEFIVRIRAHAQKCMRRQGEVVRQDEDVMPYTMFLTFGRLDNRWKLKEILLPADAEKLVGQENIDQDSNAQQLQWYYQHKRAV